MSDPLAIRGYYGILVTGITTSKSLMQAVIDAYAALSPAQDIPRMGAAEVCLYAAFDNSAKVLIGDAALSATNYARALKAGESRRYGPYRMSAAPIDSIYVMAEDGVTEVSLGIEIIPA